jgi:hypothetical protein
MCSTVNAMSAASIWSTAGYDGNETWSWGVSFDLTHRKSYGYAPSLDEARAAFRAEYEAWTNKNGSTLNAYNPRLAN